MRRKLGIGVVSVALLGVCIWQMTRESLPEWDRTLPPTQMPTVKHDGDAEPSDVIEPLVVDRAMQGLVAFTEPPVVAMAPLDRVVLEPGMTQPARPDERRRMPYADEEDSLPIRGSFFPVQATLGVLAWTHPLLWGRVRINRPVFITCFWNEEADFLCPVEQHPVPMFKLP